MSFEFFPAELRALPQWMCAGAGDPSSPDYKRPIDPKSQRWGSPTDPSTWSTFDQAISRGYPLVGFVFNAADPYSVIDLDTYKAQDDRTRSLHAEILRHAGTYCETSQSGFGTHIIGRGALRDGARNEANAIEMYSDGRFMICTGRVTDGVVKPVADIQPLLDYLYPMLKNGGAHGKISWRDLDQGEQGPLDDDDLIEKISNAENGDKFTRLCLGDMSDYGNDHSSADMALIQFLCFYTPDNEQVRRLFLMSELGQREKAYRADYVPRTIARARQMIANDAPPLVDVSAMLERAKALQAPPAIAHPDPPLRAPDKPATFPPGIIGEIAQYILASATRPVPEIALATGIAVTAGIAARQYNCSMPLTGLNQYILLLAKTGTGKESVQAGVDRLFAEVQKTIPMCDRFLGPAHFSSGPALVKTFQEKPCFLSILGEFGFRLKAMTHPRAGSAEKTLMSAMLDIYTKSGHGQMLRSSVYSDREKNTQIVAAPALTLLGETTPEAFFAGLDEGLIETGFLPRFLVVEYEGDRPARNRQVIPSPPPELVQRVSDLCAAVLQMEQNGTVNVVTMGPEAQAMLDQFDEYADDQMRGANEVTRQLWNRAHLKATRMAALVAVGVNAYHPFVEPAHVDWAVDMVRRDIAVMHNRFITGNVGEGDSKLQADLVGVVKKYFEVGPPSWTKYHAKGCVPGRFLQQQTANRSAFRNHRAGATRALKDTLEAMVQYGLLALVDRKQAQEMFQTSSAVYCLGDHWHDA